MIGHNLYIFRSFHYFVFLKKNFIHTINEKKIFFTFTHLISYNVVNSRDLFLFYVMPFLNAEF